MGTLSRRAAVLVWLALALGYFLTAPANRFEADDAYDYAAAVERAHVADMLNPYHPLYLPLTRVTYNLTRTVVPNVTAIEVMRVMGAAAAAGAVVVFYILAGRLADAGRAQRFYGAAGLAASYAFWRYAGEVEIYAFGALAAVTVLLAAASLSGRVAIPLIGILAVIAILSHIVNVAAVILIPAILSIRGWPWRKIAVTALLASLVLVGTTYLIYRVGRTSPYAFWADGGYLGYYTGHGVTATANPRDLLPGMFVIASTVIAANFLFMFAPFRGLITDVFPSNALSEELSMGTTAPPALGWLGLITFVLAAAGLAATGRRVFARSPGRTRRATLLPATWIVAYSLIVVAGGTVAQPEVWVIMLVPLWMLLVARLVGSPTRDALMFVAPVLLAFHSFVGGLLPLYFGEDRQAELGAWFVENAQSGDLVLTADSAGLARYISYASPAHAAHIGYQGSAEESVAVIADLDRMLQAGAPNSEILSYLSRGGALSGYWPVGAGEMRIFVTKDLFEPPPWVESARPEVAGALRSLAANHASSFDEVVGANHVLVRSSN